MSNLQNKSIILFDGVCNLCTSSVNFIIKHDKKERFLFASLQSDAAKEILLQFSSKKIDLTTLILIENGVSYDKSTAALLVSRHLNGGIQLFYGFFIFPKFMRDFVYNFIAKNRYTVFGRSKECMVPSPAVKNRFL